ncbi:MAG: hypothetical protein J6T67_00490 [Paludibacteraceae bacterium]|nr:hypothetical protein [Paludibacteraceae bacterium]MBR4713796.1 hypothetical protein [Paludibacteraceae bacterium]MBR5374691.1 hypothetical protein [Paludibacteraceae bacterium]
MRALKILLISILPSGVMAEDYVFKVDENLNTSISDTVYYKGEKLDAYQDAKTWLMEQKWTAQTTNDKLNEGFDFEVNMTTKFRYNPIIKTSYSDFITCKGRISVENDRVILNFDNIQFGESVKGFGQKTNSQPLSQKLYKLRKEKKERAKVEADDTLDKKAKKKQLSEHDKVIKDIEDSLKEVDEEFRLRLKNLHNAL